MNFDIYEFTNPGGRERNEDCIASRRFPDGVFCIAADGLGGHRDGDLASRKVTETFLDTEFPVSNEETWLPEQMERANSTLLFLQKERNSNMKSTAAALLIQNSHAVWANVGDTRVYFLHGGEIVSVTEDHSVAYRKYKAGEISRQEIASDPDQSSLLRVLGNADRHKPSLFLPPIQVEAGDGFLLCTDGMWEYVSNGEIQMEFLKSGCASEWGEGLLLRAISRVQPEHDNLSLITLRID